MSSTASNTSYQQWPHHVARRMTDMVHNEVKSMVATSRLVRKNSNNVVLASRPDLHVGRLLGQGAFSEVREVQVIRSRNNSNNGEEDKNKVYAMKHLKHKLMSQADNFRLAAAELAVEAHMLASFDHPNIIKVRGWAANGVASFATGRHDSFFLLLDKLDETLDQRITQWQQLQAQWQNEEAHERQQQLAASAAAASSHHHGMNESHGVIADVWRMFTQSRSSNSNSSSSSSSVDHSTHHNNHTASANLQCHHNHQDLLQQQQQEQQRDLRQQHQEQLLLEKLSVCTEIASALAYLHQQGVIFRDLKPNNIGFLNGRVKLFDFGLSRELPEQDLTEPFEMSGKVGTLRYMAVEVACHQAYNVSADVYSWAMVSYEVLTLQKPFAGWTRDMHANLVCGRGVRPDLVCENSSSNSGNNGNHNVTFHLSNPVQQLLDAAWCQHAYRRPCMPTVFHKMQQLEQEQLVQFQHVLKQQEEKQLQLQQQQQQRHSLQHQDSNRSMVVELPQDFSIVRKAPARMYSETLTSGTVSLSMESITDRGAMNF